MRSRLVGRWCEGGRVDVKIEISPEGRGSYSMLVLCIPANVATTAVR